MSPDTRAARKPARRDRAPERTATHRLPGAARLRRLSGHLHAYKVDIAKQCSRCAARSARVLLACSSTSAHATSDFGSLTRICRSLPRSRCPMASASLMSALGGHVSEYPQAWEIVAEADRANLGLALDSSHMFATGTSRERWRKSRRRRSSLSSSPTSCGSRSLARGAHQHRAALPGFSPAKVCTARRSPSSCVRSIAWATAATTASKCSTTTTTQVPVAVVTERARRS